MIYGLKFLILDSYELFYRVHSGQSSLEGNQLLKNLLIKANYGNSVLSPSFDCTSISYLQLMTRDAIFVTERHGEDIRKIYNQLNSSIPNKSLKAYLEHNLERIFKEIRA